MKRSALVCIVLGMALVTLGALVIAEHDVFDGVGIAVAGFLSMAIGVLRERG